MHVLHSSIVYIYKNVNEQKKRSKYFKQLTYRLYLSLLFHEDEFEESTVKSIGSVGLVFVDLGTNSIIQP